MVRLLRRRLGRPDQQARAVVHERQVADQRDRAARRRRRSWASAAPMAVDTVPSMPATPRLDRTCDAVRVQPDQRGVAHRVGRAEHQLVARPQRRRRPPPRRADPVVSGCASSCVAHRLDGVPLHLGAAAQPAPGRASPVVTARVPVACELPDTSGQRGPGGQREHRHRRVGQQRRHRPVQRRAAEHDHLLRAQQRQRQRVQRVGGRRRGRLGDRRQRGEVRVHTRAVSGDDDGVRGEVDVERLVERHRRRVGPRPAVGPARRARRTRSVAASGTSGSRSGMSNCTGPGVGGARTRGGHQNSAGRRAPLRVERVHPLGRILGQAEADGGAHLRAEVAELLHRLVGAGAQQLVGPVGAQHDQRHARVVGLDDRGPEVGDRGARRHRHAHRRARRDGQPDRQIAGGALVDADVQPEAAGPVGVVQGERQRRVARSGAQHDVADAAANQFVDDDAGLCRRWVHLTSHTSLLTRARRRISAPRR